MRSRAKGIKIKIGRSVKSNLRDLIMLILVIWQESPYQNFMNFSIYGGLWALWIILAYISNPGAFTRVMKYRFGVWIMLWLASMFILSLFNRAVFSVLTCIYPIIAISLVYYIEAKEKNAIKRFVYYYAIYGMAIAVKSITALITNPMISRILASSDRNVTAPYATPFIANFCTINNLPILCTILLFSLRNRLLNKIERTFALLLLALNIVLLVMSQYFIAITMLAVSIISLIVIDRKSKNSSLIVSISFVIILCFAFVFRQQILGILVNTTKGVTHDRINEILLLVSRQNLNSVSDISLRVKNYSSSVNSFISNPLLGVGGKVYRANGLVGGHSQIIDSFAYYGFFIGSLFVVLLWNFQKYYSVHLHNGFQRVFFLVFIVYFINNILNLCYAPEMLICVFFIAPGTLYVLQERMVKTKQRV